MVSFFSLIRLAADDSIHERSRRTMEHAQAPEVTVRQSADALPSGQNMRTTPPASIMPQGSDINCPTCAAAQAASQDSLPSYVYVIGHIQPRYPLPSVEKEFKQAIKRAGRAATVDLTDRAALQKVLHEADNRYLVRQLCWVLQVQGVDTYILLPRDPGDYRLLVDALR